jgi:hypothetical protein
MPENFSIVKSPTTHEGNDRRNPGGSHTGFRNSSEIQGPVLVPAFIHSLHIEPAKDNRPPRKVRYLSMLVSSLLRPQIEAMVGVFKIEAGIPLF